MKAACWLSALQWGNKCAIYRALAPLKGTLTPLDWGDRVLLVREPGAQRQVAERWVADTGLPPAKLMQALQAQLRKWGLPSADVSALPLTGHKRASRRA